MEERYEHYCEVNNGKPVYQIQQVVIDNYVDEDASNVLATVAALGAGTLVGAAVIATGGVAVPVLAAGAATAEAVGFVATATAAATGAVTAAKATWDFTKSLFRRS